MSTQATLCPFCRGLNSAGERRCYRCGRALPGPLASGVIGVFKNALSGEAPITRLLVGMCLALFALCVASERRLPIFSDSFAMSTTVRFGALFGPLGQIEPWRYLAAVFLHFNVLHVGMNCWSLLAVGPNAERQFGRARYLVLFVASGVVGFLVSTWWYGGFSPHTVGASGAIFGTFASVVGVAYARRDPTWKQHLLQNVVSLAIMGFMFPANNAAHAGGLVTGAVFGFLFAKESRRLKLDVPFGLLAGLLLLLSLASVALSAVSPIWRSIRAQELSREY